MCLERGVKLLYTICMGMEQPRYGENPETRLRKIQEMGAQPFDIMVAQVPESAILQFMQDKILTDEIASAKWPTDEATCELIAERRGLGAIEVAAISKYQRGLLAEKEKGGGMH